MVWTHIHIIKFYIKNIVYAMYIDKVVHHFGGSMLYGVNQEHIFGYMTFKGEEQLDYF